MTIANPQSRDEIDLQRAENYEVLAHLLASAPEAEVLAMLSQAGAGDSSVLGKAWADLALAAQTATPASCKREFFDLFIGVGRGELLPYASFYITGFLNERPLAELRGDLRRLGIGRRPEDHDPEDRISMLCAVMAAYARGDFEGLSDIPTEAAFFAQHLAPWAKLFFSDLQAAPAAKFYAAVGRVGQSFIDIETQAFALAAQGPAAA